MIPGEVAIYLCTQPIDMRYGFDRLCKLMRDYTRQEPQQGGLFVFSNKAATRLKVLWFERHGVCVLYKRLHRANFVLPTEHGELSLNINRAQLAALLQGKERPRKKRYKGGLTSKPIVRTTGQYDQGGAARSVEDASASVRSCGE